jgi:hypothetical protein
MQIGDLFGAIRIGEPIASDRLQVFPLLLPEDAEATYVLLDELLERGEAEITEVDAGGSVPDLAVDNRSEHDALLLDGMELHGAKQNRMVNLTLIIAGKSRTTIPVSCVERGRWSYRSPVFSSSGRTVSSRLRMSKSGAVLASLKSGGQGYANQMHVWDEVDQYLSKSGARSATDALSDVFARQEKNLKNLTDSLRGLDAHGAVVVLGGRVEGMDLLTRRASFHRAWPCLLDGYAVEALLDDAPHDLPADRDMVADWLRQAAAGARLTRLSVPGVGEYHECLSSVATGGIVSHKGAIVHAMLFPLRSSENAGAPADRVA